MNPKTCPNCDTPIPPHAPGGLCPACVLREADAASPSADDAPPPGEVAAAFPKLEILRLIGHGGMGFVYLARQPELDRMVALKILSPALRRDPAFEERFAREARVLGKLRHPNIVTLHEHGESGGFFYLLMEYVDGVNLRQAMAAGRFSPEQALAIVPAICDALQSAHAQGVWHRDIKPENILLDRSGGVKIVDFGIARIFGDPVRDFTLTRTGGLLGSAPYMAPEQHEKPHQVDHRADIYSLGVVIYEMLTGELPLGRFPLPSQRAEVGKRIDEIVLQTLEKERELRQQSAEEVKTDVRRAARDESAPAAPLAQKQNGAGMSKLTVWAIGLGMGGFLMAWTGAEAEWKAPTAGAFLRGIGNVSFVFGILMGAWALYEAKPEWCRKTGFGWLRIIGTVLLVIAITTSVLLGGLALMTGYDFPTEKGWVLGMGALVFAATAVVLCAPARLITGLSSEFFVRFRFLHWVMAVTAILASAIVAKKIDGNWPNAGYLKTIDADVNNIPDNAELTHLLRRAAGDRADDYRLDVRGSRLSITTYASEPGHTEACNRRLLQILPPGANWNPYRGVDIHYPRSSTNPSRAVVWAVASLAAVLTAMAGGRRTAWLVVAGTLLHCVLIPTPVWPLAGLPPLVTGPPLPPFSPSELQQTPEIVMPAADSSEEIERARMPWPHDKPEGPERHEVEIREFIRKMNQAANESDLDKFLDCYVGQARINVESGFSIYSPVETMSLMAGTVSGVRLFGNGDLEVVLELQRHTGINAFVRVRLFGHTGDGKWYCTCGTVEPSPYRAACRVEFLPKQGDTRKVLKSHLKNNEFRPVAGEEGQFDIWAFSTVPQLAKHQADEAARELQGSLKPFGMDAAYRIVKPAEVPISPWPGEDFPSESTPPP